jgi:hypothetical protein
MDFWGLIASLLMVKLYPHKMRMSTEWGLKRESILYIGEQRDNGSGNVGHVERTIVLA